MGRYRPLLPFLVLLSACGSEPMGPNRAPTSSASLPIVSPYAVGNWSPGVVAVFTGGVRPCSGVLVSRGSGSTGALILTSSSCIPQGLAQTGVTVSFRTDAGLTAPAGSFASVSYVRHPQEGVDAALVALGVTIGAGEYLAPMSMTGIPPALGTRLMCYGYGRSTQRLSPTLVKW